MHVVNVKTLSGDMNGLSGFDYVYGMVVNFTHVLASYIPMFTYNTS